jgi:chemosensory pili system protein ChpA (sensor histidine kinase/response regulator)
VSDKLNEMWAALAEHQPAPEYAEAWQTMLRERTEDAAPREARAASAWAAATAARAAWAAADAAEAAWAAAEAAEAAAEAAEAAQRAIDAIRRVTP